MGGNECEIERKSHLIYVRLFADMNYYPQTIFCFQIDWKWIRIRIRSINHFGANTFAGFLFKHH